MFLEAQYLQIGELVPKKLVRQLQCEDTLTSSTPLTLRWKAENDVKIRTYGLLQHIS